MVRRGWSAIPAPAGWYEIIRGPRPPSVQWPKKGKGKGNQDDVGVQHRGGAGIPGSGARVPGGRWNRGDSQRSAKIRSLAGALAALGPEDSSAKTELEGALKRAKAQEGAPTRFDPDARVGAARERVARLEQAIAAMGNCQGPELDMLITSLKKAQKDAQEMPLEAQIRAREAFIERSKKRIEQFDVERAAEVQRLEESQRRLEELRAMVLVQPIAPQPVDASAEVSRLQQMVLDLQRQLQGPVAPLVVSPFRSRKREDYVPATEEEVLEWLADRQEDMNTALMAGNPVEAGRISGLITDATRSLRPTGAEPSMVSNMVR